MARGSRTVVATEPMGGAKLDRTLELSPPYGRQTSLRGLAPLLSPTDPTSIPTGTPTSILHRKTVGTVLYGSANTRLINLTLDVCVNPTSPIGVC